MKAFTKHTKAESNVEESIITLSERKGRKRAVERLKQLDESQLDLEKRRQGYQTLLAVSPDLSHDPKIQKDMSDQRAILDQQLEAVLIKKHKLHVYLATLDGVSPPPPPDLISVKSASNLQHPRSGSISYVPPTSNFGSNGTVRVSSSVPPSIDTTATAAVNAVISDVDATPKVSKSASINKFADDGLLKPQITETSPAKRVSVANFGGNASATSRVSSNTPSSATSSNSGNVSTPPAATIPATTTTIVTTIVTTTKDETPTDPEPDSPSKVDLVRKLMISHQEALAKKSKSHDDSEGLGSSLATPLSSSDNIASPSVTIGKAKVLYAFDGSPDEPDSSELAVVVGDEVDILEKLDDGWWRAKKMDSQGKWIEGFVPGSYMQEVGML